MSESIKVAVRVRPYIHAYEKVDGIKCIISMNKELQQTSIEHPDTGVKKTFTFDYSYNSFVPEDAEDHASQETVWNDLGVGVLENAWQGFNVSLFAYGQTGSGKSHSMMGYPGAEGIVPRACRELFKRIDRESAEENSCIFKVEASMLEIYNEKVRDLFNPALGGPSGLKVRDNPKTGPYVQGLTKFAVSDYDSISKAMEAGTRARTVAATAMNATSSRAHTIFQVILTQTKTDENTGKATDRVATISLIDLAGSERANRTGASGDRLKEGCAINQSLSALGNVIFALAEKSTNPKKKGRVIPYRDSALTHLLKNSLGGNAKTVMIAAVSPSDVNYEETLSTLRYADRAKQIKNKAVVNEDENVKMIRGLKEEIEALKSRLATEMRSEASPTIEISQQQDAAQVETLKKKWEDEKEREIQALRAQMKENELLVKESQKTWEQKLSDTSSKVEKNLPSGFDKDRAKTVPHIVNLNQDKQITGVLAHFFEQGLTRIGRDDAEEKQDVCLVGLSIQKQHCVVTTIGNDVSLKPCQGAQTMVNGKSAEDTVKLRHGDRLIFGNNQTFLFWLPHEMKQSYEEERKVLIEQGNPWELAMKEVNEAKISMLTQGEREAREQAEKEAREMQEKVRALEEKIKQERELAKKAQDAATSNEKVQLQQDQMLLEQKLQDEIEETKRERARAEHSRRLRDMVEGQIMDVLPMISEANAMSSELRKEEEFSIQLVAQRKLDLDAKDEVMETQLWVKVEKASSDIPQLWMHEKFMNRLFLMREMYQDFLECGREFEVIDNAYNAENDPFSDPPEAVVIGKAYVILGSLLYLLNVDVMPPVINYKGKTDGALHVLISLDEEQVDKFEESECEDELTLNEFIGQSLKLKVKVVGAKGLPRNLSTDVSVSYKFYNEDTHRTAPCQTRTTNPKLNDEVSLEIPIDEAFCKYVEKGHLEFQVWGSPDQETKKPSKSIIEQKREEKTESKVEETKAEERKIEATEAMWKGKLAQAEKAKTALEADLREMKKRYDISASKEIELEKQVKQLRAELHESKEKAAQLEAQVGALQSTVTLGKEGGDKGQGSAACVAM